MALPFLTPEQFTFIDTKANIEALTGLVGGERGYATDTGEKGHYDAVGAAWVWGAGGVTTLHRHKFLLPFGVYTEINPITGVVANPYMATVDRSLNIIKWTQAAYVVAPNDASNYWEIRLTRWNGFSLIQSLDTSLSSAATFLSLSYTFSSVSASTSDAGLYINVVKHGSPGGLYLAGPALEVEG